MGKAVVINADDPQQQRVEWVKEKRGDRQQGSEPKEVAPQLGQESVLLVVCANRCFGYSCC